LGPFSFPTLPQKPPKDLHRSDPIGGPNRVFLRLHGE
jgi:hypothetical protein